MTPRLAAAIARQYRYHAARYRRTNQLLSAILRTQNGRNHPLYQRAEERDEAAHVQLEAFEDRIYQTYGIRPYYICNAARLNGDI